MDTENELHELSDEYFCSMKHGVGRKYKLIGDLLICMDDILYCRWDADNLRLDFRDRNWINIPDKGKVIFNDLIKELVR
jgi:hypothetical protein